MVIREGLRLIRWSNSVLDIGQMKRPSFTLNMMSPVKEARHPKAERPLTFFHVSVESVQISRSRNKDKLRLPQLHY